MNLQFINNGYYKVLTFVAYNSLNMTKLLFFAFFFGQYIIQQKDCTLGIGFSVHP